MSDLKQLCIDLEHFETPEWAARAILKKEILTLDVVDPCCGTGVLGDCADDAGYQTLFLDVQDWGHQPTMIYNWLSSGDHVDSYVAGMVRDATVFMNPPFSKSCEFVEKAFELGARKTVCFQRFAWWESQGRRAFWEKYPPARVYICGERANCWRHDIPREQRGSSTPTAYAWFVWEQSAPVGTLLGHIWKDEA
jgi:predicted RNA methylase